MNAAPQDSRPDFRRAARSASLLTALLAGSFLAGPALAGPACTVGEPSADPAFSWQLPAGESRTASPFGAGALIFGGDGTAADCSDTASNPSPIYDPGPVHTIQVVVHVIQNTGCTQGALSDALVASQIAVLNEDFGALPGTPGAAGVDTGIRFALATVDPQGQPTTGITRHCNTTWFNDQTSVNPYYDTIAWDPERYLNLYSNSANGARGYVPFLPAANPAAIGTNADRVVINWQAFGRPGPVPAHAGGRTATHEIGHFFGLFHVYYNGCGLATAPQCYSTGDTLCDTPQDDTSHQGCMTAATSCGGVPIPAWNYMELSDDSCLTGFTLEQARRARCTIAHFRSGLAGAAPLFGDGFESGDATHWSAVTP